MKYFILHIRIWFLILINSYILLDKRLFRKVNDCVCRCKALTAIMVILAQFGEIWLLLFISMLVYDFCYPNEEWIRLTIYSLIFAGIISRLLKLVIDRSRPSILPGAIITGPCIKNRSFPSSRTASIFSVVCVYISYIPYCSIRLISFAILVALSRVYIGDHYPLDVVFGALLGILIAGLILLYR